MDFEKRHKGTDRNGMWNDLDIPGVRRNDTADSVLGPRNCLITLLIEL